MPRTSIYREGFTLIEMIVFMLIVSILTATVLVRIGAKSERAAINQADQLRRDLSHIQMLALSWGVSLRLAVPAGGGSYLVCLTTAATCASSGDAVIDPATGERFSVTMSDGVIIVPSRGNTIDFDSLGRPTSGGSLVDANPAQTYKLKVGNDVRATVLLRPITGFAEAS